MKVAITVPWTERLGGAETLLMTFLRHVDRARVDPIVVFFASGPLEREVAALRIPTVVIEAGRLRQAMRAAKTIRALRSLFKHEQVEFVLDWSAKTHLYGAPAAALARLGGRTAWWQHTIPTGMWLDRAAAVLPAEVVFCSSAAAALAQERLPLSPRAIPILPGTESPHRSEPEAVDALRRSLGIREATFVAGIVGRLQPWKRQDILIRAIAALHSQGLDAHGLIVGGDAYGLSPEYAPSLNVLVAELGIADRITFVPHVDNVTPYVELMDVLVNASEEEPFGLVLIEAMALGVPVLAYDAGGPAEIIDNDISGVLLQGEPVGALVDALAQLKMDNGLRDRLAAGGYERRKQVFSAESFGARLTEQLEHFAHRPTPRRR